MFCFGVFRLCFVLGFFGFVLVWFWVWFYFFLRLPFSTGMFAHVRTAPEPLETPQLRPFPTTNFIKSWKKYYCFSSELPSRPAPCEVFPEHLSWDSVCKQNLETKSWSMEACMLFWAFSGMKNKCLGNGSWYRQLQNMYNSGSSLYHLHVLK